MDRAGELDLALDALNLAAAEGDPGTDARWLPEGIVAEAQHGDAVDLADALARGLDVDRAVGQHLVNAFLNQIGAVDLHIDCVIHVLGGDDLAAGLAGPVACLGEDVGDFQHSRGQLAPIFA